VLPAGDSDAVYELNASDEVSALVGTVAMDFSPTPLCTTAVPFPSRLSRVMHREQGKRFRFALLCATLIVGGVAALLTVIGFLLSR
jgi:hypothetical protein